VAGRTGLFRDREGTGEKGRAAFAVHDFASRRELWKKGF
jgi:hypothetical protein